MIDYLRLYADELAGICAPGERVLALAGVQYAAGEEQLGSPARGVSFDIVNGLSVARWNAAAYQFIGGASLAGAPGSAATHLRDTVDPHPLVELALTNQRLLLLTNLGGSNPINIEWSCPLRIVAGIRHEPRWNQRGRITIAFSDGSLVRLIAGYIFTGKARRFVEASRTLGIPS